ncbi:MAG: phosphomevalonate decarboxylase MvaD [Halobacteriaceae archaeon]
MKATARAHPIQGLVKYHGMHDETARYPYHDSISVCTAPSNTTTTVAFDPDLDAAHYVIDGEPVTGRGAERIDAVVDRIRDIAETDLPPVRLVSENNVPSNIGFGSSSSGFAAAAVALAAAADLDLSAPEISTIARRGSASAARSVTGGYSDLHAGLNDRDCRSHRIDVPDALPENHRIVAALVPTYKETEAAHAEAADSHMFEARLAHVHGQLAAMRDALETGDQARVFEIAEHDSLSLAATTMTGPAGWVYWQPETLRVFETVRSLRESGITAYFSVDTGASVYVNTTAEDVDRVAAAIEDLGIETRTWEVGGPAHVLPESEALF